MANPKEKKFQLGCEKGFAAVFLKHAKSKRPAPPKKDVQKPFGDW